MLTQKRLKQVLNYDSNTGVFTRLECFQRPDVVGKPTSCNTGDNGYTRIAVDGSRYTCHRLAWLYVTGTWPEHEIDHINGIRSDNRYKNLREATSLINKQNQRKARCDSSSGLLGVSWDAPRNKWVARIKVQKVYKYLGRFDSKEDAHSAYVSAKRIYHEGCTL